MENQGEKKSVPISTHHLSFPIKQHQKQLSSDSRCQGGKGVEKVRKRPLVVRFLQHHDFFFLQNSVKMNTPKPRLQNIKPRPFFFLVFPPHLLHLHFHHTSHTPPQPHPAPFLHLFPWFFSEEGVCCCRDLKRSFFSRDIFGGDVGKRGGVFGAWKE